MFTRKLFTAVTLSIALAGVALPALGKNTDIPPPPGQWGPGDFPSSGPAGTEYIGISGIPGNNNVTREYKVHVPKSYRAGVATPLVFCLHAVVETTTMFCVDGSNTSGPGPNGDTGSFITQSDNDGFILVMPQGFHHAWNAGACCSRRYDDVAFIRAVLAEVETHLNVDTKRVYAAGWSNGAFMSEKLACDASDLFAAIVDGSGGIVTGGCTPQNHVAVLQFHGNKDHIVPYALMNSTDTKWANLNGCNAATTSASFPNSGGDTTCVTHTGCPADGTVTACTIDGGGHCWYGSPSCGTGFGPLAAKIALLGASNSNFTVESDDFWPFLKQFHR